MGVDDDLDEDLLNEVDLAGYEDGEEETLGGDDELGEVDEDEGQEQDEEELPSQVRSLTAYMRH